MSKALYAGIELGGTKVVCLLARGINDIVDSMRIPTTTPDETLGRVSEFIRRHGPVAGIGVGSFGPINVDPDDPQYGTMETTPKPGWPAAEIYRFFHERFRCPVTIDTDVNAAGLAEYHFGAARGLHNFIYVTLGTGIGAAALIDGKPVRGLSHPEMGHLALLRVDGDEAFTSVCPYHEHCAEGLASGTAIGQRWHAPLNELPETHAAWEYQADYVAQFCHALILFYSPLRIIFGGGVSSEMLLMRVREKLKKKLNGYIKSLLQSSALEYGLCLPELGDQAGPTGSLLLALPKTE